MILPVLPLALILFMVFGAVSQPLFASGNRFVFFCAGGWRSALAAKTAQDMGLTPVAHLHGGFGAWKKSGAPVATIEPKQVR